MSCIWTALRWKVYKILCRIAWRICPDHNHIILNHIWVEGLNRVCRDLAARQEPPDTEFATALLELYEE